MTRLQRAMAAQGPAREVLHRRRECGAVARADECSIRPPASRRPDRTRHAQDVDAPSKRPPRFRAGMGEWTCAPGPPREPAGRPSRRSSRAVPAGDEQQRPPSRTRAQISRHPDFFRYNAGLASRAGRRGPGRRPVPGYTSARPSASWQSTPFNHPLISCARAGPVFARAARRW